MTNGTKTQKGCGGEGGGGGRESFLTSSFYKQDFKKYFYFIKLISRDRGGEGGGRERERERMMMSNGSQFILTGMPDLAKVDIPDER